MFAAPEPDRAGFVRANDGVQLYYEQDGPVDAPVTVVLVHGFCQNRDDLLFQRRALLAEFGARIRIVSFDLRSHGRSRAATAEHATIDQLGADLDVVLRELVPTGPVVLIGHSMGGMTILALADARPELFRRPGRRRRADQHVDRQARLAHARRAGRPGPVGDPAFRLALRGVQPAQQPASNAAAPG